MTVHRSFDRDLEVWLDAAAPMSAPGGLHDAAMDRVRTARQRPGWLVALRGGTLGTSLRETGRPTLRVAYLLVILGLVLAVALIALATGTFRPNPLEQFRARNGVIAYSLGDIQGRPTYHTRLMAPDGTSDVEIAQGSCPAYSRDGSTLAWMSGAFDTAEVQVAAPDGSSPRTIPGIGDESFALSPDGTRIAWFKAIRPIKSLDGNITVGASNELWVMPVAGGEAILLVPRPDQPTDWYSSPVWSPDGRSIAYAINRTVFVRDNGGAYRDAIGIVSADAPEPRRLTSRIGTDFVGLSWSPDSRQVAYVGIPDGGPIPSLTTGTGPPTSFYPPLDVFVVNADGTGDRNVTSTRAEEIKPQWSPDGTRLAYLAFEPGTGYRLATVPMDGPIAVGPRVLGPVTQEYVWSPDATTLLWLEMVITDLPETDQGSQQDIATTVSTIDAAFLNPSVPLLEVDYSIGCVSWQRLAP